MDNPLELSIWLIPYLAANRRKNMKRQRLALLTLVLTSAFLCLSGCKKENSNSGSNEQNNNAKPDAANFLDFENFNPDFQLLRLQQGFGKVSVNTDKNYVKGGEQSAKLQPLGAYAKDEKPFMYFQLASEKYGYAYNDMKLLYSMTLWMYSTSEETKEMTVGVVTSFIDIENVTRDGGLTYRLNQGWNKVTYFIEKEDIYVPTGDTKIHGLYLEFDNAKSRDLADAPVYYLDNVSLDVKSEAIDIMVENHSFGRPVEGDTIIIPNASIPGGEVTTTVLFNGAPIEAGSRSFVATKGGDYRIVYQSVINDYIYKKYVDVFVKPTNALNVVNFETSDKLNSIEARTSVVERIEWMEEFENQRGVAKITINRDWPSLNFYPQEADLDSYDNYEYLVVRIYIQSGENTLQMLSLNDAARPEGYQGHLDLNKWVLYKFPIASFLANKTESYFVGNSTSYIYQGTFYLAEIFAM